MIKLSIAGAAGTVGDKPAARRFGLTNDQAWGKGFMDFLAPNFLWCLLFIPLIVILSYRAKFRRRRALRQLLGDRATDPEFVNVSEGKRSFKLWVFVLAFFFLVISLARPHWGQRPLPFTGRGRDILVALDVSKSMMSHDIAGSNGAKSAPSRLTHAKWLLKELIKDTPGDRYGLIAFAGRAFLECPLTGDRTSLFNMLNEISFDSIPVGGTNLQEALQTATRAFAAAAGNYKAIILVTDGDEVYGNVSSIIDDLKAMGVPLLVVGVGDPERGIIQIPDANGNLKTVLDAKGNPVNAKLNEPLLNRLAKETGGSYIRTTPGNSGLRSLLANVNQLVPEKYSQGKMTRPLERFHVPLLLSVALFLLWLAVGERRDAAKRQPAAKAAALIALSFLVCLSAQANPTGPSTAAAPPMTSTIPSAPGQTNVQPAPGTQPMAPAAATMGEPKKSDAKSDAINAFNQAVEAQREHKNEDAVKLYTDAINLAKDNPKVRGGSYQNMGVIKHQEARKIMLQTPDKSLPLLDEAEELYRESMRAYPNQVEVAVNQQILLKDREKAKEIIKRRKEMEQKKQQARQKTQEAKQQQQKANQAKSPQQQKQQQKQADQKTQEAQKAAEDFQKAAQKAGNKQEENAAEQAKKNIQNARQNQRNKQGQQAENDLSKALQNLGGEMNKQEQMNQKRQDAQNKTQQALNKQQQANQAQSQQQKQQKQNEADQKTQEAKKAVQDYKDAAKQNAKPEDQKQNRNQKDQARKAEQALKKAQKAQKDKDGKKAEEELKKALEELKKAKPDDQQKKDDQGKKGEKQKPDDKGQDKKEQPRQNQNQNQDQNQGPQQKPKYDEKEIDPRQAARLIDLMAKDEKSLRKELKKRMKENYGVAPVDKDW